MIFFNLYLNILKFLIFSYWECLTKLLWLRFEMIMNFHNESVRSFDVTKKVQLLVDTRPHYVTFLKIYN